MQTTLLAGPDDAFLPQLAAPATLAAEAGSQPSPPAPTLALASRIS